MIPAMCFIATKSVTRVYNLYNNYSLLAFTLGYCYRNKIDCLSPQNVCLFTSTITYCCGYYSEVVL